MSNVVCVSSIQMHAPCMNAISQLWLTTVKESQLSRHMLMLVQISVLECANTG